MDRRKIKSRWLHQKVNIQDTQSSTASTEEVNDAFASGNLSQRSQRTSNTELLRASQRSSKTNLLRQQSNLIAPSTSGTNKRRESEPNLDIIDESPDSSAKENELPDIFSSPRAKRVRVSESPSPVKKAPEKEARDPRVSRKPTGFVPRNRPQAANVLSQFFSHIGIVPDESDTHYILESDPLLTVKKIQQALLSGDYSKETVLRKLDNYLSEDLGQDNKCLNPTTINSSDGRQMDSFKSSSIIKIFLQVPAIQSNVLNSLLTKLNETIVAADSPDSVPWAYQLLQQLRFLEVVNDPEALTLKLEELLETSPIWFQRELITFIPDIVTDTQHQMIAEILCKLMEAQRELTNVILDCISNLSLGKEFLEELRETMLTLLGRNCHIDQMAAIIKFTLDDCPSIDVCQTVLRNLRVLELQPLDGENSEEYYSNQTIIVSALRMVIVLSKEMANAAINVVASTSSNKQAKPFDLIILLLLYEGTVKKKKAEAILKQHIKTAFYRSSLLNDFYSGYQEVVKDLQSAALNMASNLLKSEDGVLIDFTTDWFRHQFLIHGELIHKQREIVEKLIVLMGNNDQTAKNALAILCKMTKNRDERRYLQAHCHYLRILLEKMEKLDLKEVTMLNDLLHALCASSNTITDTLRDDLFILLSKQLSCHDGIVKSKGVAGGVMAIKHLATSEEELKMAVDIFKKILSGVKECPRSRGFFYDTLGSIIAQNDDIKVEFLNEIIKLIEDEFFNVYITDSYDGPLKPTFRLNASNDLQGLLVKFGPGKYEGIAPTLLRLMKICNQHIGNERLKISEFFNCAVLMPADLDLPDAQTIDLMFHCINWFRELINSCVTERNPLLQRLISKRLANVMQLQGELATLLSLADARYQAPPCYFHSFPLPSFNKVEKKSSKKGKKGTEDKDKDKSVAEKTLPEWESWEMGSLLSTKNPMYFRRLDAEILYLLDVTIPVQMSQTNVDNVSTGQVCFIIKELLASFNEDNVTEKFMKDLISQLSKICMKLSDFVDKLRVEESSQHNYAFRLILSLLTAIFNWKGFNNPAHHELLREGLRTLAGQVDESNLTLRSARELVSESYKYFESLADVATQISIASELVDTCKALMKHSTTFSREKKDKQAKMAYGFLCLEWPNDRQTSPLFRSSVSRLLKNWLEHEPNPLETVSSVLEWLPEKANTLEKPQDKLARLPTIMRSNLHNLYQKLYEAFLKGTKLALQPAMTDVQKLKVWKEVALNLSRLVAICKKVSTKSMLMAYLRCTPALLKIFLESAIPTFEHCLRNHADEVTSTIKMVQGGTRYLNAICCHSTEQKDIALSKLIPNAKTILEKMVYSVKGMLVFNNTSSAFWMGNLLNKNLDGQAILSQGSVSTDERPTSVTDSSVQSDDDVLSDILDDDQDEENDNSNIGDGDE
ncbi:Fanconi anemia group D2 protein homolog [Cotesia glomerata]|uniref:Fanconi anemia group D2 protein n=1 Tax=Cotesia glomerata TaxID=32391 RepID=A0AAV7IRZ1_COTGL|nr:Fanconi anemia group D2 protein homolog [Cotesia glomerata]XP_044593284.1 Fanconi anemia group D2 protein homolog [Cotesia glomerata]KAH0557840.1 hypothetical protein KQX54_012192 [Cotesia glomerata]